MLALVASGACKWLEHFFRRLHSIFVLLLVQCRIFVAPVHHKRARIGPAGLILKTDGTETLSKLVNCPQMLCCTRERERQAQGKKCQESAKRKCSVTMAKQSKATAAKVRSAKWKERKRKETPKQKKNWCQKRATHQASHLERLSPAVHSEVQQRDNQSHTSRFGSMAEQEQAELRERHRAVVQQTRSQQAAQRETELNSFQLFAGAIDHFPLPESAQTLIRRNQERQLSATCDQFHHGTNGKKEQKKPVTVFTNNATATMTRRTKSRMWLLLRP
jgi:hypothetical protein